MGFTAALHRDDGTHDEPGITSPWSDWVAASSTLNFCCEDPLLDWLEAFGEAKGHTPDHLRPGYDARADFRVFLNRRSAEFENAVTNYLASQYDVVRIRRENGQVRARAAAEATWIAMSRGVHIIAQGVLWNPESRTYGSPDLLIRSDVLRRLFPNDVSDEETAQVAPDLGIPTGHYRVMDTKFTTLDLLKDGHAANDHLKYAVQVCLYNEALGRLQGYTPGAAFLLGRRWKDSKTRGTSALDRIARIDCNRFVKSEGVDLRTFAMSACDWVRRLQRNGAEWDVAPTPSVPELWPNIRRTDDQPWHQAKLEIAQHLEDLTLLPRVTPQKRLHAIAAGLCRWTDPACCAAQLAITGEKLPALVDAVIYANHSAADGPVVFPERVTANEMLWRIPATPEFYVDFETVTDLDEDFSRFPEVNGQPLIFMIGCAHFSGPADNPQWNHRTFTAKSLTLAEELRVIGDWLEHVQHVCQQVGAPLDRARLFHWSPAETSNLTEAYNAAHTRHGHPNWPTIPWFDLLNRVVKEQPVTVRGAFSFGLKAFARALHEHGLIETVWRDGPADGLGAMVAAWWCNREAGRRGVPMTELELMHQVEAYNEIDCRVMAESLAYLRRCR